MNKAWTNDSVALDEGFCYLWTSCDLRPDSL